LSRYTGFPAEWFFDPDRGLRGFLKDEAGLARWLPLSELPWPVDRVTLMP
jgi:hypothetical protein